MSKRADPQALRCPKCASEQFDVVEYSDTIDFRGIDLDVDNLRITKCNSCQHAWTTKAQHSHNNEATRAVYAVQRDLLRARDGLLAGPEIAKLRERFDLSQREAASLFGGGYNAFNKYESGEVLQSYAMDRLLRLSAAIGKPSIEFLRNVSARPTFTVIANSHNSEVRVQFFIGNTNIRAGDVITSNQNSGTSDPFGTFETTYDEIFSEGKSTRLAFQRAPGTK